METYKGIEYGINEENGKWEATVGGQVLDSDTARGIRMRISYALKGVIQEPETSATGTDQ